MLLFKRLFTVRALLPTEVLSLSMQNVDRMRLEFPDIWQLELSCQSYDKYFRFLDKQYIYLVWQDLVLNSYQRFSIEAQLKIQAIKHCEKLYQRSNRRSKWEEHRLNGSYQGEDDQLQQQKDGIMKQETIRVKGDIIDIFTQKGQNFPIQGIVFNIFHKVHCVFQTSTKQAMTIKQVEEEVIFKEHLRAVGKLDEYILQQEQSYTSQPSQLDPPQSSPKLQQLDGSTSNGYSNAFSSPSVSPKRPQLQKRVSLHAKDLVEDLNLHFRRILNRQKVDIGSFKINNQRRPKLAQKFKSQEMQQKGDQNNITYVHHRIDRLESMLLQVCSKIDAIQSDIQSIKDKSSASVRETSQQSRNETMINSNMPQLQPIA